MRRLVCWLTYHQLYVVHGHAACLRCGRTWPSVTE